MPITIDEMEKHPRFATLSEPQREYLRRRTVGHQDKLAAAKSCGWACKDDRSYLSMANAAERKPHIKYFIEEFFDLLHVPSKEEIVSQCWAWAQAAQDDKARADFAKIAIAAYPKEEAITPHEPNDGNEPFDLN